MSRSAVPSNSLNVTVAPLIVRVLSRHATRRSGLPSCAVATPSGPRFQVPVISGPNASTMMIGASLFENRH